MNKRMMELARQAGFYAHTYIEDEDISSDCCLAKFAELIVKECAGAADMAQAARCKDAGDYVAEQLGFGQEQGVTAWRMQK